MSVVINVEADQVVHVTTSRKTTMTEAISPLLTSMKLFGMFFTRHSQVSHKSRNVYMMYAVVVVILLWLNVLRMFSVFTNQ